MSSSSAELILQKAEECLMSKTLFLTIPRPSCPVLDSVIKRGLAKLRSRLIPAPPAPVPLPPTPPAFEEDSFCEFGADEPATVAAAPAPQTETIPPEKVAAAPSEPIVEPPSVVPEEKKRPEQPIPEAIAIASTDREDEKEKNAPVAAEIKSEEPPVIDDKQKDEPTELVVSASDEPLPPPPVLDDKPKEEPTEHAEPKKDVPPVKRDEEEEEVEEDETPTQEKKSEVPMYLPTPPPIGVLRDDDSSESSSSYGNSDDDMGGEEEEVEEEMAEVACKPVMSVKDFVYDEAEGSGDSDSDEEVPEYKDGEKLGADGEWHKLDKDGNWTDVSLIDNRPWDELLDEEEPDYEEVKRRNRRSRRRLIRNLGSDEENEIAKKTGQIEIDVEEEEAKNEDQSEDDKEKQKRKVDATAGRFFRSAPGDAALEEKKQKVVNYAKEEIEEVNSRKRPVAQKVPAAATAVASQPPAKHKKRALEIGKEMGPELFWNMFKLAAINRGFAVCYGGYSQGEQPYEAYMKTKGRALVDLKLEVKNARGQEAVNRDLECIINAVTAGSASEERRPPAATSSKKPTDACALQKLLRMAGTAFNLQFFVPPDNCPTDPIVRAAASSFAIRPNNAVIAKMERTDPNDCRVIKKSCVLVTKTVAVYMMYTHCLVNVDAFIKRSKPIRKWCDANRQAIRGGTKTLAEVDADLRDAAKVMWKKWLAMREEFCSSF